MNLKSIYYQDRSFQKKIALLCDLGLSIVCVLQKRL
jgi:hypothetical protein